VADHLLHLVLPGEHGNNVSNSQKSATRMTETAGIAPKRKINFSPAQLLAHDDAAAAQRPTMSSVPNPCSTYPPGTPSTVYPLSAATGSHLRPTQSPASHVGTRRIGSERGGSTASHRAERRRTRRLRSPTPSEMCSRTKAPLWSASSPATLPLELLVPFWLLVFSSPFFHGSFSPRTGLAFFSLKLKNRGGFWVFFLFCARRNWNWGCFLSLVLRAWEHVVKNRGFRNYFFFLRKSLGSRGSVTCSLAFLPSCVLSSAGVESLSWCGAER
jgi:hypothetical protein